MTALPGRVDRFEGGSWAMERRASRVSMCRVGGADADDGEASSAGDSHADSMAVSCRRRGLLLRRARRVGWAVLTSAACHETRVATRRRSDEAGEGAARLAEAGPVVRAAGGEPGTIGGHETWVTPTTISYISRWTGRNGAQRMSARCGPGFERQGSVPWRRRRQPARQPNLSGRYISVISSRGRSPRASVPRLTSAA